MSEDNISSVLGTKEYWQEFYENELENFHDHGAVGEIWFGENSVKRIIRWLTTSVMSKTDPVLDVGCGNGDTTTLLSPGNIAFLFLAKAGFQDLTGIDYVEEAVKLAASVAKKENAIISYEAVDFLQDFTTLPSSSLLHRKYKVIIDKGTYDAISLCPDDGLGKRQRYVHQVNKILYADGILILTSCNWTKDELLQTFESFQVIDEICAPAFSFGGKSGNTVTTLVMKQKQ